MAKGECSCGAVAFETDAVLSSVFVCHCSLCRRSSGGNGVHVVIVGRDAFRWTRGQEHIQSWSHPDADWKNWFCGTCGSRLPGDNDGEQLFIPAGLLTEGADDLAVAHHIWVGSKASWDEIGDDGRQHHKAFSG